MSHYNIDYSSISSPSEKRTKALADICSYLGSQDKFDELSLAFIAESEAAGGKGISQRIFSFYCSMAGIQGYPVIAWWEHLFTDWKDEPEADIIDLVEYKQSRRT